MPSGRTAATWAVGFAVLTSVGLGVVAWGVLVLHALTYGAVALVSPATGVVAPDVDRYRLALVLAVMLNLGAAALLAWWGARTWARAWPAVAVGAGAALAAGVVSAGVLLMALGISPVDLVRSSVAG